MAQLISAQEKRPQGLKANKKDRFRHDSAALACARAKRSSHALTLVVPVDTFWKFQISAKFVKQLCVYIRLHRRIASIDHTSVRARLLAVP
jgi:hypothetical protein